MGNKRPTNEVLGDLRALFKRRPGLSTLLNGPPSEDLGGDWKFGCRECNSTVLWIELLDPDGVIWRHWCSFGSYVAPARWIVYRIQKNEEEKDYPSNFSPVDVIAALERLIQKFQ